jgi:hypothetical protein
MSSLYAQRMGIFGRPAIGLTEKLAITGYLARGCLLRNQGISGLRLTGVLKAQRTSSTLAIGDRTSATTVA